MYLKTKGIGKRLWHKDNIVSKNPKYVNDPRSQLIFYKSMYDLCPYKKRLFCHKQTKGRHVYSPTYYLNLQLKKHNILFSN
jgi:hypothetical protein